MSDWMHMQQDRFEQLALHHHFSVIKQQHGRDIPFRITVKEFATPPPGQNVRFFAEADREVNQNIAPFVPCGWSNSLYSALGDSLRLIRQFPYEGELPPSGT